MFLSALGFLGGILLFLYPPPAVAWLLLPLLAWRPARRRAPWLLAGALWAALHPPPELLDAALEGQDLLLRGSLVSLPAADTARQRFRFRAEARRVGNDWQPFHHELRLSWYRAPLRLGAGDRWQFRVRLKRPRGFANPGGFDYGRWLRRQGFTATGYVRPSPDNRRLGAASGLPLLKLRQHLLRQIDRALEGRAGQGVVTALALGQREGIDPAQWQRLRATGTAHLVAISGLHVGLLAGLGFLLGRGLWSRSSHLTRRLAAQRAGALSAIALATAYALLAGFSIPTQRALLMVTLAGLVLLLGRPLRPMPLFGTALLGVLLLDPHAVQDPGFWLSFTAVGLLLWAGLGRRGPRPPLPRLQALLRSSLLLTVGLAPVTALAFGQAAWLSPLANLLAIPWVTLLVVPLSLLGTALLGIGVEAGGTLLRLAAGGFEALDRVLGWLAALPGAAGWLPPPEPVALLLAVTGVLWLAAPRGFPGRWVAGLLLLPLLLLRPPQPPPGHAWFSLLDVGQGLAAVVRTRNHVLVYDTGPRFASGFETGSAVLRPFLLQAGLRAVDLLIVSHGDNDHIGGARGLTRSLPVYQVISSVPQRLDWRRAARCDRPRRWSWDGVGFELIHPAGRRRWRGNNASCVLRVVAADGQALLLPGDIEAAAERALLHGTADLGADLLVVPHHGSRTSSTAAFIERVGPRYALFAVGYRNRFGFPRPEIAARYRQRGIRLLDTATAGAIHFRLGSGPQGLRPRTSRP
ncbi:DNA internalization-related competence protein ComEC/Rec2 [Thiohalobacter sp. IOR34]|uniref:DNA internalization-related competence protein ComEC/Rec2 n=1 Tax=Thiohalobacter sp. IOR34 TaxID=3057176 RepID=UPI0025B14FAE|nr:DNA internalization-related competence protein ComEC/Rec2 [Thiohalobacter sp. IOR34]WJW76777.1 DNA internalization-related competence protein ComEC/Rec2 [Thiohalobacter sp. IOR34]